MVKKSKDLCRGCYNDCYNHGTGGAKECWSYPDAVVKQRFSLHYMTAPTVPRAFHEVETLSCYRQVNNRVFYDKLPDFAVDPVLLKVVKQEEPPPLTDEDFPF